MRVLVTGGAGYVGSVVTGVLLNAGHEVVVLDSLVYGGDALIGFYAQDNFRFVRADVRDADSIKLALQGIEAVVHLAAIVGDPACARQPDVARDVNLRASLQLFQLSREAGVNRFVFASTCSNYGKMLDPAQPLTETSELRPVSLYAETKVEVERAILDAAPHGGPAVTILRLATVFGLSPRMRFDLTVNEFTMELMTKGTLQVFGEQFWRPYLHVRDAARMVAHVLGAPVSAVSGQVFNVGDSSQNFQKRQIVDQICAALGREVRVEHVHREEDPRDYRVSFEKAASVGFRITRTVQQGIQEIIDAITQSVITDCDNPKYRD